MAVVRRTSSAGTARGTASAATCCVRSEDPSPLRETFVAAAACCAMATTTTAAHVGDEYCSPMTVVSKTAHSERTNE